MKLFATLAFMLSLSAYGLDRDAYLKEIIDDSEDFEAFTQLGDLKDKNFFLIGEFHNYKEHEELNVDYFEYVISLFSNAPQWCLFLEAKIDDAEVLYKIMESADDQAKLDQILEQMGYLNFDLYLFGFLPYLKIARRIGAKVFLVDDREDFFERNRIMAKRILEHFQNDGCEKGFMEIGQSHVDDYEEQGDGKPLQDLIEKLQVYTVGVYAGEYHDEKINRTFLNWNLCNDQFAFCPQLQKTTIFKDFSRFTDHPVLYRDRERLTRFASTDAQIFMKEAHLLPPLVEIPPLPPIPPRVYFKDHRELPGQE